MGKVPYFLGLAMKANSVIFLNAVKRREDGTNVNLRYLIRMAKIAEYHGNLFKGKLSLETINKMINKLENKYMVIKKQGWEGRESFITTLIEQAEGSNKTKLKEIRKKRK